MNSVALEHARTRLERATKAVEALRLAVSHSEQEEAWSTFLTASSAFYSKLEQGAKTSGKSAAWFGRVKVERKKDPLLSYIHHARNSDEHGIERITERSFRYNLDFPASHPFSELTAFEVDKELPWVDVEIKVPGLVPSKLIPRKTKHSRLCTVTDQRYGDSFEPPSSHLGNPLQHPEPLDVAELGLIYLTRLLEVAGSFEI